MFKNIGDKIQTLALVLTSLGIIASVVGSIIFAIAFKDTIPYVVMPSLIIAIIGFIVSWVSNLTLYGFGKLVENSDKIVEMLKEDEE